MGEICDEAIKLVDTARGVFSLTGLDPPELMFLQVRPAASGQVKSRPGQTMPGLVLDGCTRCSKR